MNDLPRSAEQAYFQAIESLFVRLRGSPLLLSPADWQVAQQWREAGIPLSVVQEALEELFRQRAERGVRSKVNSLRYCRRAVESAWEERQEMVGPAQEARASFALDVGAALQRLEASLPERLPGRDRWVARLRALAGEAAPKVEAALTLLDDELLAAAREQLGAEERETLRAELAEALARVPERFPAEELRRLREQLERQLLRRRCGLPLLTLFD